MRLALVLAVLVAVPALVLALAVALGGPRAPPPMASISDPFRAVDFSGLPPLQHLAARDGLSLAYRSYPAAGGGAPAGSALLVHGSSARSDSMHPLASALSKAGFAVVAADVRGHGDSGPKGRLGHVGQLEDDLEDLLAGTALPRPRLLVGFSSGGGFTLRFAADPRQRLLDGVLLLSPLLYREPETSRPGTGGWVSVGVPRLVALSLLDRAGLARGPLGDLPVVAFALGERERAFLTPSYGYRLAANFRSHDDWRADARRATRPMELLAGTDDEVFRTDRFEAAFRAAGRPVPVTLVRGVSHIGLTLQPAALEAVVAAAGRVAAAAPPR